MYSPQKVMEDLSRSISGSLSLELGENTCADLHNNGASGGCYWLKEDSSVVARSVYQSFVDMGYKPQGILRQDYLQWTSTLLSPDSSQKILLTVMPTVSDSPVSSTMYRKYKEGFASRVAFEVKNLNN